METIYYRLNAARITVEGDRKVSGGEGVRCVVLPAGARSGTPAGGKVLDFEAYRRSLRPAPAVQGEPAGGRTAKRRPSPWLFADLCASAAVVVFTALAALGIFLG